jgi:hypothetical protein
MGCEPPTERTNKCEPCCFFFDSTFLKLAFAFFLRSSSLLQPKSQSCFGLVPPLTTFLICTRGKETLRVGPRAFIMVSLVIGPCDFFIPFFTCKKAQRSKLTSIDSSNRCSAAAPAPRQNRGNPPLSSRIRHRGPGLPLPRRPHRSPSHHPRQIHYPRRFPAAHFSPRSFSSLQHHRRKSTRTPIFKYRGLEGCS